MAERKGRIENASMNTVWAILSQGICVILGLFSRKIFLDHLGAELLGVSSLFSDVLLLFSFADLGIGTAIMFSMYRPIAENDNRKIQSLLMFYRDIYNFVMSALIVLSILFVPFLYTLNTQIDLGDLIVYYGIFQISNILGYLWAYRYCYVIAIQRERVLTRINLFFTITTTLVLIMCVVVSENYLIYLLTQLTCSLISKVWINSYIVKHYPITKISNASKLDKTEKKSILKKSYALLVTKVGNLLINQTDSLVVSIMINVSQWGLASNYLVIKRSIFTITDKIYSGILPSMGNLVAGDDKKKELEVFLCYDFLNAWLHTFCFVALSTLSTPFIALFFGESVVLPYTFVFFFFLAAFVDGLRSPVSVLREASGTFEVDKWYTMVAAGVNLIVSFPLAYYLGLYGVFIGTICAMAVLHVGRSWVLFRRGEYNITTLKYLQRIIIYVAIGILLLYITNSVCSLGGGLFDNAYLSFMVKMLVTLVLPNLIWVSLFYRNQNLRFLFNYIKQYRR